MSSERVLGVVLLTRHGDRQGFYQSPDNYTPVQTAITPLGLVQEYQLGQLIRSLYFNASSPSIISGISTGLFDQNQVRIRADAGGEGGVIYDSTVALSQGLWPAATAFNTTLANGTTVIAPLNGYQYAPIETVEPESDVSLEGWTECNTFATATTAFYNSTEFKEMADASADFLASLRPIVGPDRPLKLTNMIYDFLNVQSIHNQSLAQQITPDILARARVLANWHQYRTFSSPNIGGIGNIAGRTIIPDIVSSLNAFANDSQPLRFTYLSMSYKPFISLFNMTEVASEYPSLQGIVDYASAVTFELRQPSSGGPPRNLQHVRRKSRYGPSEFTSRLSPYGINDLSDWCTACSNWKDRKCNLIAAANSSTVIYRRIGVSPIGAGFIGAGLLTFGRRSRKERPMLPVVSKDSASNSGTESVAEK
ncbi:histidine phosphatase family containing protein [Rhizoctonia solani]|uniref:Histidine phosphatase family containing protein n=1 Tax=Rhizoctonia solani TaxID=456999 RepID=A0A8H8NSU5_9AGAM|nr:histidine phosphatase family containing protein [Rhizoctonia solani]QRW17723.1 histidine phosphatase family containing protein [Rhizoctonia solani]